MIERMLRAAGVRTGLFTSPHLVDFSERIRIDGRAASPEAIEQALARVEAVPAPPGVPRTFFEACFGLAAVAFAEANVETAVIEVGLGGRLDATNVLAPALAVITPIALDHQEVLGHSLAAIAAEKAGILKDREPAVVALQEPAAANVIEQALRARRGSRLEPARVRDIHRLDARGSEVTFERSDGSTLRARVALVGRHQVDNAATALAACAHVAAGSVDGAREGLERVRWPGRFEACPAEPRLWWDGAHNAAGAAVARAAWRDALGDPPGTLVLGLAEDKDPAAMLAALAGPWRRVVTVAAASPRARDAANLATVVRTAWPHVPVLAAGPVEDGVRAALTALGPGERAFVAGSLFVVGEAMAATGTGDLACL
jgi:dihydrofolate synthase/folylpolyglutamate synthase